MSKLISKVKEIIKEGFINCDEHNVEMWLLEQLETLSPERECQRCKKLEDKVKILQHAIDNNVLVIGEKDLVAKIKEFKALLEICLIWLPEDHTNGLKDEIEQAIGKGAGK